MLQTRLVTSSILPNAIFSLENYISRNSYINEYYHFCFMNLDIVRLASCIVIQYVLVSLDKFTYFLDKTQFTMASFRQWWPTDLLCPNRFFTHWVAEVVWPYCFLAIGATSLVSDLKFWWTNRPMTNATCLIITFTITRTFCSSTKARRHFSTG